MNDWLRIKEWKFNRRTPLTPVPRIEKPDDVFDDTPDTGTFSYDYDGKTTRH